MPGGRFTKQLDELAKHIERACGGWKYLNPGSAQVGVRPLPSGLGEIYCGEGRYDPDKKNALMFKNGIAINFQIIFSPSEQQPKLEEFSLCCVSPDQVRILYHFNPAQAREDHPKYHLQLTTDGQDAIWEGETMRYPIGEMDPIEILRFFFRLGRQEPCLKVKQASQ